MTVGDALKAVGAEGKWFVSYRAMVTFSRSKRKADAWIGTCKYDNGELTSLDGDYYSLEDEIEWYEKIEDLLGDWNGRIVVYIKIE